ncbi:restriction endonuclease subunit M [Polaribacter sejongensis]
MSLIEKGIKEKLITLTKDGKQIKYLHQNKPRNYTNPEEQVQAITFLKLVLEYGYNPKRIKQFVSVTMGSEKKEADLVVYNDDDCKEPHILVECKRREVNEQEFQQAIEQAYSYAYALPNEVKYVWVTSGIKDEFFSVDKSKDTREEEPDIPQFGVDKLAPYKYVYEADDMQFKLGEQKFSDLKVINQENLTEVFKQAHKSLWGGGQLNPSEAFDELDKLIFCKIWDERKDREIGDPYDFQIFKEKNEDKTNIELSKRIKALYEEGRKFDEEVFKDDIRLTPEKLRTVVGYLESINLSDTDLDSKGRAFETFMGSFFRGNFGQYFTPRPIVDFVVSVLPITNKSYVLDTSCGSGGFLLHALDKVRRHADKIYPKHKTDVKQHAKHHKHWHDFAENYLYGIEINEQIARTAKMNMIIHDDGHTNVVATDGLTPPRILPATPDETDEQKKLRERLNKTSIEAVTKNQGFNYDHFNFIITNPPFGSLIKQTEKAYMHQYNLSYKEKDWLDLKGKNKSRRPQQSTEILFIEKCHKYLAEDGYMAVVIPDGILTNSSLQYVRDNIETWFRIIAVVSMPQTAFSATGAGVKSSVLILKKWSKKETLKLKEKIASLQLDVINTYNYEEQVNDWNSEKRKKFKEYIGYNGETKNLAKKEIESSDSFKAWKAEINEFYKEKIESLKDELNEKLISEKQNNLIDYPIFMAIAEDIGYDATGNLTKNNELEIIGKELTNFINSVEDGTI